MVRMPAIRAVLIPGAVVTSGWEVGDVGDDERLGIVVRVTDMGDGWDVRRRREALQSPVPVAKTRREN